MFEILVMIQCSPLLPDNDGDALHFLLVIFHKSNVCLEGGNILPAAKLARVDQ